MARPAAPAAAFGTCSTIRRPVSMYQHATRPHPSRSLSHSNSPESALSPLKPSAAAAAAAAAAAQQQQQQGTEPRSDHAPAAGGGSDACQPRRYRWAQWARRGRRAPLQGERRADDGDGGEHHGGASHPGRQLHAVARVQSAGGDGHCSQVVRHGPGVVKADAAEGDARQVDGGEHILQVAAGGQAGGRVGSG